METGVEVAFFLVGAIELLVEKELETVFEGASGEASGDEVLCAVYCCRLESWLRAADSPCSNKKAVEDVLLGVVGVA